MSRTARILTIAGSDSGGGAGIQADIKTITMLGGHAMTAITAITAQNTLGLDAVQVLPAAIVLAQIDAVVRDIGVDAIKIGMLGSAEVAEAVATALFSRWDGHDMPPLVFDPVMVTSSGAALADASTIAAFGRLMGLSTLLTPNLPELGVLAGVDAAAFEDEATLVDAAVALVRRAGTAVLVKGGHATGPELIDRLIGRNGIECRWSDARIDTDQTHGTGCTLSSAIATGLGQGMGLGDAIERARRYVRAALEAAPGLGAGQGPMGHGLGQRFS